MKRLLKLALLGLLFTSSAHALGTDSDAPVHIEADQVEMHEKEGISIYSGHVRITKGSIKISGERITIKNRNGRLHLILILGEPATFSQLNDQGEEISARSMRMEYRADNGLLELKEDAQLVKNQNRFNSAHIIYDTQKDIVTAGQEAQKDSQEAPRVQITIQPDKSKKQP